MQKLFSSWYLLGFALTCVGCLAAWFALASGPSPNTLATSESKGHSDSPVTSVRVETVKPQQGGLERTTTQPGTVIAFESAQLLAKVPGYLKSQAVDIGDHVRQGQVLAEIDAPERLKEVDQAKAAVGQANAQVAQALARIHTTEADEKAAEAAIKQAEAEVERAAATRALREKEYKRIEKLFELESVDEGLVDEKLDERDAARASERLAQAGVANAKALANAAAARIEQAKADANDAKAKVDLAAAALAKAEVFAGYLKIVSPYDGVVTNRNFFRGDFIRSADQNGHVPLLAVDRTDRMRVVVQIPDPDVPFTNPGDEAVVEIDNLPGVHFSGKVSRIADAEDTETRTMRAEIDLPNEKNRLRQGMYGRVTIRLVTSTTALRVPSSSLVGAMTDGKGAVYVCQHGVARLVPVQIGRDDGLHIEILQGLSPEDDVIHRPSAALFDGARVTVMSAAANTKAVTEDARGK